MGIFYYAVAYRFGNMDGHTYVVLVSDDKDKILKEAEDHVWYRGGKYGIAVYEQKGGSHESHGERIAYFPSIMDEVDLLRDHSHTFDTSLARDVSDAVYRGFVSLPSDHGTLVPHQVDDVPSWLITIVKRYKENVDSMLAMQRQERQERAKDTTSFGESE